MKAKIKPANIWVVDDDVSIGWVLEKALGKHGYQTATFRGVKSMLKALKLDRPDLVISDIQMPGVDGLKLLELMHQNFPAIPVIIMTAYSDYETTITSYKKGAFEYLAKPFDIQDTLDIVAKALRSPDDKEKAYQRHGTRLAGRIYWQEELTQHVNTLINNGQSDIAHRLYEQIDDLLIQAALRHTDGHKQKAAKMLGWGRNTLTRKIKQISRQRMN